MIKIIEDKEWTKWDSFKFELYWIFVKPIKNVYYWIFNAFIAKTHIIKTNLAIGYWWDVDGRMLNGMMNLLIEYIEKQKPFEYIDWDNDEDHKKAKDEIIAIRDWWLNYDNRKKEINKALNKWHSAKFGEETEYREDWIEKINEDDTPEIKELFDNLHKLEEDLEKETTEMLIRLIKIRGFLWV